MMRLLAVCLLLTVTGCETRSARPSAPSEEDVPVAWDRLQRETERLRRENSALHSENVLLHSRRSQLQQEVDGFKAEKQTLQLDLKSLQHEISLAEQRLELTRRQIAQEEQYLQDLRSRVVTEQRMWSTSTRSDSLSFQDSAVRGVSTSEEPRVIDSPRRVEEQETHNSDRLLKEAVLEHLEQQGAGSCRLIRFRGRTPTLAHAFRGSRRRHFRTDPINGITYYVELYVSGAAMKAWYRPRRAH